MQKDDHGKIVLPDSVMQELEAMGPVREIPRTGAQEKCPDCRGYGFWATGDRTPMGRMDAGDGMPTTECGVCHANPNPADGPG